MDTPQGDIDVLAIGETVVDLISLKHTESLLDAHSFRKYAGGAPANLATNVARLGGKAAIVSKIGAGPFGQFLKDEFDKAGVITDHLVMTPDLNSTVIFIARTAGTAESQALRDADYKLRPDEISYEAIRRARIVHASAFALSREPCRFAVEEAFRIAKSSGKIVSLDPNYNPPVWPNQEEAASVLSRLFAYVTITKPSLDDAQRLFGAGRAPEWYIDQYQAMGPKVIVLTMGSKGVFISDRNGLVHVPARKIEVVDATGAGDAFWSGFLMALLDGHSLQRCALFAREIVERKLTSVGPLTEPVDRWDIFNRIDKFHKMSE